MEYTPTVVTVVNITNGGSGYTSAPTVTLEGGGGSGATATAVVVDGAVTSINITVPGTGYDAANPPVVKFSGGGGSGATASATAENRGVVTYSIDAEGRFTKPTSWTGRRASPGRIQTAISGVLTARQNLVDALTDYDRVTKAMATKIDLFNSAVNAHFNAVLANNLYDTEKLIKDGVILALNAAKDGSTDAMQESRDQGLAFSTSFPLVAGVAADATSGLRSSALKLGYLAAAGFKKAADKTDEAIQYLELAQSALERVLDTNLGEIAWKDENLQLIAGLRDDLQSETDKTSAVDTALRALDQAQRDLRATTAEGNRVQQERLVFRQHTAAIVQGYRTRDFAFRAFRDEALERYRTLFDLSALYTYLAARAYDYETGLLDRDRNPKATAFYEKIVQARALGVVSDGQPQFAGSSGGDPGLSGVLAQMDADWSVARTRLGFNNPDHYRTTFSLRTENFRVLSGGDGDLAWKDKLSSFKKANILDDPDVKRYCMQVADASGLPVPGFVISFQTTISDGFNFFSRPLAGGDHSFTPSSFATKIRSSGIAFAGYIGMDSSSTTTSALAGAGATSPAPPNTSFADPQSLSATPYVYLIPAGVDSMRSPPLGDTSTVRTWQVEDQSIPLPFNIAGSAYSTQPAWVSVASLSEPAFSLRKHQAFRAVPDGTDFSTDAGFTNARLIGRSVWNSQWKLVIPGKTLLNDPTKGVQIFLDTVSDIKLHLESYSYSGN